MNDSILTSFLERQYIEVMALAGNSDLLDVTPVGSEPYQRYVIDYRCKGLVLTKRGVVEHDHFGVGIRLALDYLRRRLPPWEVLMLLWPERTYHPNINFPAICPGRMSAGTPLVDLIYQCFEIISFQKVTMSERDALNLDACAWARKNKDRFPIDTRPLKRRRPDFKIELKTAKEEQS